MTPREHDDQLARVRSDRASHDVYPNRAAARDLPHMVELDDAEREFLADLLLDAVTARAVPGKFDRTPAEVKLANELRDRIRLPARDRRSADEMGSSDGLGA